MNNLISYITSIRDQITSVNFMNSPMQSSSILIKPDAGLYPVTITHRTIFDVKSPGKPNVCNLDRNLSYLSKDKNMILSGTQGLLSTLTNQKVSQSRESFPLSISPNNKLYSQGESFPLSISPNNKLYSQGESISPNHRYISQKFGSNGIEESAISSDMRLQSKPNNGSEFAKDTQTTKLPFGIPSDYIQNQDLNLSMDLHRSRIVSSGLGLIHENFYNDGLQLLDDNLGELELMDARKYMPRVANTHNDVILEDIPTKISGTYNEDYNIVYVDEIIRKKLKQEKFTHLHGLKLRFKNLENLSMQPQTYVMREKTLESMKKLSDEIEQIESGEKLRIYESRVKYILSEYRKFNGRVKTVVFDINDEDQYEELDDDLRYRVCLIEQYLDIACDYIQIDVIRINNRPADICSGCGISLAKVATSEEGTIRCPNPDCQTEHNVIILAKLAKDGSRINTNNNTDDESIDNFLRAFTRYQGLQADRPDDSLYNELDAYFSRHDRPSGAEIRQLHLNNKGRRGDTDHKMLWNALSQIGRSEYYEDANLIGHLYWGWTLPNVMHLKERIIDKYNKTQKVFYQIPPEERGRNSSLGTQYRLWRHLQLEGHDCYMDEFKIAENPESLRTHNRLWRLMCDGANDPDIHYIP